MEPWNTIRSLFTRRDVVVLVVLFSVVGTVAGVLILPPEWSLWMRVLGGFAIGFNGSLFVIGPRMVGGEDYD